MRKFVLATTLFGAGRVGERDFAAAAESGFDRVALDAASGQIDPRDAATLSAAAASAGVRIESVSCGFDTAPEWCKAARDLGWPLLVLALGPCSLTPAARPADLKTGRQRIEALAAALPSKGLGLALQAPAGGGFNAEVVAEYAESFDDLRIGVCLDAGHAHLSGGAPEAADTLSGSLFAAVLHDNNGREDSHRAPGEGSIDWPATLMTCWKSGFTGPWIIAITGQGGAAPALTRAVGARARLQAILEDLAQPMAFTE
jgi:sugar phosphate isomerase/epimerase